MQTLLLPGLDGTGELFAACAQRLAPEPGARVVRYPSDRPLGYREIEEQIDVPGGGSRSWPSPSPGRSVCRSPRGTASG